MNKNNRNAKLAAIAILPALGIAAFAGSVFAADGTSTSTASGAATSSWMFGHKGHHDNTTFATSLASILGLSATDVKAKLDAGQTPTAIITAAGKTVPDVMTQLRALGQANMQAKLAAAVASGKITQAQADAKLAHEANESNETHLGHHGHGGLFRGMMGTNNTSTNSTQ